MRARAFKLAFEDDRGVQHVSDYGYHNYDAAQEAAPTLNLVRFIRGKARYTHVLELSGERPIAIQELEAAA